MNIKYAAVPIILALAACSPMDAVEGKPSASKDFHDRLALLEANYAARAVQTPPVTPVAPATIADGVAPPVPVYTPPPQPECTDNVFRVSKCVDGKIQPWS